MEPGANLPPEINKTKTIPNLNQPNANPHKKKSRVRDYIREIKESEAELKRLNIQSQSQVPHNLEDLYDVTTLGSMRSESVRSELRKSLRAHKEKDMTIIKLRELCHELNLKYADAENTIDSMRFNGRVEGGGGCRRSTSEFQLSQVIRDPEEGLNLFLRPRRETRDQSTETNDEANILAQIPVNWMEKVQSWKMDSGINPNCADTDSGFRGSDLEVNGGVGTVGASATSRLTRPHHQQEDTHLSAQCVPDHESSRLEVGTHPMPPTSRREPELKPNPRAPQILDQNDPSPQPRRVIMKTQSVNDLRVEVMTSPKCSNSYDSCSPYHKYKPYFQTLDPLLDEAMTIARRVQKKSIRLAKLIQYVDKKV